MTSSSRNVAWRAPVVEKADGAFRPCVCMASHLAAVFAAELAHVSREHRAEPVPSQPHGLVADIDAALEREVFGIPSREREPHVHHLHEPDHLGGRVGIAEWIGRFARAGHGVTLPGRSVHRWRRILLTPPRTASEVLLGRKADWTGAIAKIAAGSWRGKPRHQIRASGYLAYSLEASLWISIALYASQVGPSLQVALEAGQAACCHLKPRDASQL